MTRIRTLLVIGLAIGVALPVYGYNRKYSSGSTGLSVTATTQYVIFEHHTDIDGDGATTDENFLAGTVVIHNANASGGSACYYLLVNPGAATVLATETNGSRIAAASTRVEEFDLRFGGSGWQGIAMIAASGETCTAYVDAYGSKP